MKRPGLPVLLTQPTRFAGLDRRSALAIAGATVALLLLAFLLPPATPLDPTLHAAILDHLRHGADFATAAIDALRTPDPATANTVPLPTLAVIEAALPPVATASLFYALAIATLLAWAERLGDAFARLLPRALAGALLAAGVVATVRPSLIPVPAAWAALLVAWSLALHDRDRWVEPAALAAAAALVETGALAYLVVMALFALHDRRRVEAAGWLAALALAGLALAAHLLAAARLAPDIGPASTAALPLAPPLASLAVLALLGWSAWPGALAGRVLATLLALAATTVLLGRPETTLLLLTLLPLGLAALPDAVRDLFRPARTRRITVTRLRA